jgi:deoxyribonuclease V
MNIPNTLHAWNLAPEQAKQLQKDLVQHLREEPLDLASVRTVAGVDVGVKERDGRVMSQAAMVVCTFPEMEVIETVRALRPTDYPYVPGLLTFREGPVLLEAWAQLQTDPDVLIFDGMGRIHPRQMGIAAHMGLWLQRPTIGCGKTHLIGVYDTPAPERGSYSVLTIGGQARGVVLRTRTNVKPVYISAGHRMDTASAIALTMACTPRYRLPQPIRYAHNAAGKLAGEE